MLRKSVAVPVVMLVVGWSGVFGAERFIQLKIGPTWPKELQWSGKPTAGDGSVHMGLVVDRKIAFGGGIDFLWNVNKKASPIAGSNNSYKIEESQKTFMFPVSGYLALSPIPQFRFHPCLSTQIGFNTLYYANKQDSLQENSSIPIVDENGFYMGFYWKIAADVAFNLGENSELFAGLEYQVSRPDKINVERTDIFTQRDMNGVGFRFGVRIMY